MEGKAMRESERLAMAIDAYCTALLWTTSCNGWAEHEDCCGEDCDISLLDIGYGADDIPAGKMQEIRHDVDSFIASCEAERPDSLANILPLQIGHDFLLTRNHHGAGFWDRGLGELGEWLTDVAQHFPQDEDLYIPRRGVEA